jgi:hypothetical protein
MGVGMDDKRWGQVMKCASGIGREPIGPAHSSPFFDMCKYDVEFTDGMMRKYALNVIANNMYAQVDNKGNMFHFFLKIMDHKKDGMVINILDGKITLANGNTKPKITTKGRMLLVMWKDGLTSWVKLKDLKASNPGY